MLLLDPRLQEAVCPEVNHRSFPTTNCSQPSTVGPEGAAHRPVLATPANLVSLLQKRRGADGPPSGMASVTGVELSGDLQVLLCSRSFGRRLLAP